MVRMSAVALRYVPRPDPDPTLEVAPEPHREGTRTAALPTLAFRGGEGDGVIWSRHFERMEAPASSAVSSER